jgi:hypothetical protein
MRSRGLIVAAALLVLFGGTASAQGAPSARWTLGATGGLGRTWDDEGQIGAGLLAGGFAQWRWLGRTHLELAIDLLRHNRTGGAFEAEGHTTFGSATIVQRFGGTRTHGYVLGGATLAAHSGTAGFPREGLVTASNSTNPGYFFGGGLMFSASRHLDVGPVVRLMVLTADSDSDPAFATTAGLRIAFR